jgi:hypothetical protein
MLTGGERTVVLTVNGSGIFRDVVNSQGQTVSAASGNITASIGDFLSVSMARARLSVSAVGGVSFTRQFYAPPPVPPYDVGGGTSVAAELTVILQQFVTFLPQGAWVRERIKPGGGHSIKIDWTSSGDSGSTTIPIVIALGINLSYADYIGACSASASALSSGASASCRVNIAAFQCAWNSLSRSYSPSFSYGAGSSSASASGGTLQADAQATDNGPTSRPDPETYISANVRAAPRMDVAVDVVPHLFDRPYGGQYKIATVSQSLNQGESGAPSRVAPLWGPFAGAASFVDSNIGGLVRIGFSDSSAHFAGNRVTEVAWRFVSPETTFSYAPLSHDDHPTGDFIAIRGDRSQALRIIHDGNWQIEDGSTLTPTGGEWTVLGGPGSISLGPSGGIVLTNTGSSPAYFRRGWAIYAGTDVDPILTAGAALETNAFRFLRINATSTANTTLTVLLPGYYSSSGSIVPPLEGERYDPGGAVRMSKRWVLDIAATAPQPESPPEDGAVDVNPDDAIEREAEGMSASIALAPTQTSPTALLDLCNPEMWPLSDAQKAGVRHIDTPYLPNPPGSGNAGNPPEGLLLADYRLLGFGYVPGNHSVFEWGSGAHNFGGVPRWSRMVFRVEPGQSVTINSMTLLRPELRVDVGENFISILGDGKWIGRAFLRSAGGISSVEGVRASIDAMQGLSCTTTLNASTSAGDLDPPESEESRLTPTAHLLYWGGQQTNLNIGQDAQSSIGVDFPLRGAVAWHPGARFGAVGDHYGSTMHTTLRPRFGGAFGGIVLRSPHLIGTGTVLVSGLSGRIADALGRWGWSDPPVSRLEKRAISWAGWTQEPIFAGGNNRGMRRWTAFKDDAAPDGSDTIGMATSPSGRVVVGYRDASGQLVLEWKNGSDWDSVSTGLSIGPGLSLAICGGEPGHRLIVFYQLTGGGVETRSSVDEGRNWSVATTISSAATAATPALWVGATGLEYHWWVEGGAIKQQVRDAKGISIPTRTILGSGASGTGLGGVEVEATGLLIVSYIAAGGGGLVKITSSDGGLTWV